MSEREINQKVAEEIRNTFRLNGQEFRKGEWVALLNGKVVSVAKDIDSILTALRTIEPDPHAGMLLEVGPPLTDVIRRETNHGHRLFS
jgi:hypothetical protein